MSRIANNPVTIPDGVSVTIEHGTVTIKGSKGTLSRSLHPLVNVLQEAGQLKVVTVHSSKDSKAIAGTTRALLQNMVVGVSEGFERKLEVVGVGYRAQIKGDVLNLNLGFSHVIELKIPEEITVDVPSQTEIVVKGIDKQKIGQIAANIRAFRKPEPYKGKGVRYSDEKVVRKEAKKS